jgi:hypothetical protein
MRHSRIWYGFRSLDWSRESPRSAKEVRPCCDLSGRRMAGWFPEALLAAPTHPAGARAPNPFGSTDGLQESVDAGEQQRFAEELVDPG